MVESQPSKLLVAGSIPVSRSNLRSLRELQLASQSRLVHRGAQREGGLASHPSHATCTVPSDGQADLSAEARPVRRSAMREGGRAKADVAQLAERVLGKDEVTSSILVIGSNRLRPVSAPQGGAGTGPPAVAHRSA